MERAEELLAAIARQAIRDYHAGYTCKRHMDPGHWLDLAGLLTSDGQVDPRGCGDVSAPQSPQSLGEPLVYWRCNHCSARLGLVFNGKLIIGGGWHLVEGTLECRTCGRRRKWSKEPAESAKGKQ